MNDHPMTPTDLAAALLRDVPRHTIRPYVDDLPCLLEKDVLAALTAAIDGVDERAGGLLEGVTPGPWDFFQGADNADKAYFGVTAPSGDICQMSNAQAWRGKQTIANARFIAWCREGVPALLAQIAALRKERDDAVNKAKKNARIAAKAYTIITLASDDLQDEGDRVYLGSTNTADILRDAREEWAAHRIIGDSVLTIVEENRVLKTRAEAAEAEVEKLRAERDEAYKAVDENWVTHQRVIAAEAKAEKLRGAGSNLVAQLYQMWTEARDHRDRGDLGSAEYAKRDMVASAFRDAYLAALSATTEDDNG